MTAAKPHWSRRFFGELYGELYRSHLLDPGRSALEAEFALRALAAAPGPVLDLAAGFGRHARLVARRRPVVAADLNGGYLRTARRGLRGRTLANLRCVQNDMRHLPFAAGSLGGVMLLFNSFGYFTPPPMAAGDLRERMVWRPPQVFYDKGLIPGDFGVFPSGAGAAADSLPAAGGADDPNLDVLREVHRVLAPGGVFLVEVPNPRPLLQAVRKTPRRHVVTGRYEIEEEYEFDAASRVLSNRTRFRMGPRTEEAEYHLRLYDRKEMTAALRETGFRVTRVAGGYDDETFSASASEMILTVCRRA